MLFKIQNLGVVKEAEIDLGKDLILLCGQNNTGKTYVNTAIYGLLNIMITGSSANIELDISSEHTNSIAKKLIETLEADIDIESSVFDSFFYDYKNDFLNKLANYLLQELPKIFAFDNNYKNEALFSFNLSIGTIKIIKNSLYKESDSIRTTNMVFGNGEDKIIPISLGLKNEKQINLSLNPDFVKLNNNARLPFFNALLNNELSKQDVDKLKKSVNFNIYRVFNQHEGSLTKRPVIFPAQRSAINIFATELSLIKNKVLEAALRDNSLLDLAQKRTNRYSQPIKDNLEIAQDLVLIAQKTSKFAYLAEELENSILKGKITVSEYGALLYVPQENPEVRLEMHMSSSLVESLATISFYLRHLAQKNDCIMIDEPELNLHPDNQILIARFLGRLVNEGFKVIVSTHSDYIIRELSNLIILANEFSEKQSLMEKYHYRNNELLEKERVGVYYFQQGNGIVQNVPISKQGIEIDSIDRVITDLNQRSDDIYYSFVDSETE